MVAADPMEPLQRFPSPLGVKDLKADLSFVDLKREVHMFPSPLGVKDLKATLPQLLRLVFLFPSPLGVKDLKEGCTNSSIKDYIEFPSPLGVKDLKVQLPEGWDAWPEVSIPSRGKGFESFYPSGSTG